MKMPRTRSWRWLLSAATLAVAVGLALHGHASARFYPPWLL